MSNFKKISIAAAVTTALGVASTGQAITLGEPGEALLVPYVWCNSADQINTLVGISVPARLGMDVNPGVPLQFPYFPQDLGYATAPHVSGYNGGAGHGQSLPSGENLHWFFFNDKSEPVIDDGKHATPNDYVPFDWCAEVHRLHADALADGDESKRGYLVFTNDPFAIDPQKTGATFAMYGDAALIQGNWDSAAYIPVIPMADGADEKYEFEVGGQLVPAIVACQNEVRFDQGQSFPSEVNPLCAGIQLDNHNGNENTVQRDIAYFNVRYFADPALNGDTDMVVWFDRNCDGGSDGCDRNNLHLEVYDTEENHSSAIIDLPKELNVLNPSDIPGSTHTNTEDGGVSLENQGFLEIALPEIPYTDLQALVVGPHSSAVAFALIHFGVGNGNQVQTALAQERGIW